MESKDSYHHGGLRQDLLDRALEALESSGLEALSLRGLAEAAGVSKSAPYRHFSSKQELLVDLAALGFRLFADSLEGSFAASEGRPGQERNGALAVAYLEFALARPSLYRLMFSRLGYSLHSEACRQNSDRAFGILVSSVEAARQEGWKPGHGGRALALATWALVHGWAGLLIDGLIPEGLGADSWREDVLALLD